MDTALTSSRYLAPSAVVASLAVAIGVWVTPTGWLDPDVGTTRSGPSVEPAERAVPVGGASQVRPDWAALGAKLDTVRDPIQLAQDADEGEGEGEEGAAGGENGPAEPAPTRITIAWEYLGLIAKPGDNAALIRLNGQQRFVREGQTVADPSVPGGVEVVRVATDRLVVRIGGEEQELERIGKPDPLAGATPEQPTNPRGRTASRR